jgi:hypothetical protein
MGLRRRGLGRGREGASLPGGEQGFELGNGGLDLGDEEGLHPVQPEGARRRTRHNGAQAGETRLGDGGMICHEVNIIHSPPQCKSAGKFFFGLAGWPLNRRWHVWTANGANCGTCAS